MYTRAITKRIYTRIFRLFLSLMASTLLLTGCGGGSDNGTPSTSPASNATPPATTPTPPLAVTADTDEIILAENQSVNINLTIEGAQDNITIEVTGNEQSDALIIGQTQTTHNSANITLSLKEINTPDVTMDLQLVVTDGASRSDSVSISVILVNSSAELLFEEVAIVADAAEKYINLYEEQALVRKITRLSRLLNNDVSLENGQRLLREFYSEDNISRREIMARLISLLRGRESQFLAGEWSESDVAWSLNDFREQLDEFSQQTREPLAQALSMVPDLIPDIPAGKVNVDVNTGLASQFAGNPELGEYIDNEWVFFPDYAFLTAIVFPFSGTCTE